jgi:hypothetical protein
MDDLKKLIRMAKDYGIDKNELFISTAETYAVQKMAIERIKDALGGELTVGKQYVKNGSVNQYLHPAIKELPKHSDALNKTAAQMLKIIKELGTKEEKKDKLTEFIDE